MTTISLAATNLLAQDYTLSTLLGRSQSYPIWVCDEEPVNIKVEGTSRCLIVVNEEGTWTSPNEHNTMRFPRLQVDIWADPTRNEDKSVRFHDAKTKIMAIQEVVDSYFHMVDPSGPEGLPRFWGTLDEILSHTGVMVVGSHRLTGPEFFPIRDGDGGFMGRSTYGLNVV